MSETKLGGGGKFVAYRGEKRFPKFMDERSRGMCCVQEYWKSFEKVWMSEIGKGR